MLEKSGTVAHTGIPAHREAELGRSLEARGSKPAWSTWWNPFSTKNTKIRQEWWCAPVVPATQEAEVGGPLESGRQKLQWTKIEPPCSSLGKREWDTVSKTKTKMKYHGQCKVSEEFFISDLVLKMRMWNEETRSTRFSVWKYVC